MKNTSTSCKIPDYYKGRYFGIEAKKIVIDYELTHFKASAVEYILRAGKKKENGMADIDKEIEDITKAIHHLQFELERLNIVKDEQV
jgi:hypothetical protein